MPTLQDNFYGVDAPLTGDPGIDVANGGGVAGAAQGIAKGSSRWDGLGYEDEYGIFRDGEDFEQIADNIQRNIEEGRTEIDDAMMKDQQMSPDGLKKSVEKGYREGDLESPAQGQGNHINLNFGMQSPFFGPSFNFSLDLDLAENNGGITSEQKGALDKVYNKDLAAEEKDTNATKMIKGKMQESLGKTLHEDNQKFYENGRGAYENTLEKMNAIVKTGSQEIANQKFTNKDDIMHNLKTSEKLSGVMQKNNIHKSVEKQAAEKTVNKICEYAKETVTKTGKPMTMMVGKDKYTFLQDKAGGAEGLRYQVNGKEQSKAEMANKIRISASQGSQNKGTPGKTPATMVMKEVVKKAKRIADEQKRDFEQTQESALGRTR